MLSCSRVLSNTPFLPPGFSDEHSQGYITIEIPGKREAVITKVRVVQLANLKEKTVRESEGFFSGGRVWQQLLSNEITCVWLIDILAGYPSETETCVPCSCRKRIDALGEFIS